MRLMVLRSLPPRMVSTTKPHGASAFPGPRTDRTAAWSRARRADSAPSKAMHTAARRSCCLCLLRPHRSATSGNNRRLADVKMRPDDNDTGTTNLSGLVCTSRLRFCGARMSDSNSVGPGNTADWVGPQPDRLCSKCSGGTKTRWGCGMPACCRPGRGDGTRKY